MSQQLRPDTSVAAFKITSSTYTLTTLELHSTEVAAISRQLDQLSQKAPHFFQNTPIILAFDTLKNPADKIDLQALRHLIVNHRMQLASVRGAPESLKQEAESLGISCLPAPKPKTERQIKKSNIVLMNQGNLSNIQPLTEKISIHQKQPSPSTFVDRPVRSGQQIYTHGDLIVTSAVSAGAELLAGGNIHVYGPLRGRALAGVNGNSEARIFCRQFEAELISINGQYRTPNTASYFESLWGQSVLICIMNETLHMQKL